MNLLLLLLVLIAGWIVVFYVSVTTLKKYVAPYGPALLIKTRAGVNIIERASKYKFWDYFVSFFYYAMPVLAIATVGLLVYEAFLVLSIPKSAAPSLSYALALPGINPAIPVGFGIIGLIVAVALHEGAHGIAARRFNLPIRSTGLLWLIIPIGAFVEPDQEEMNKADPKTRGKIFAAGPGMNIALAVIFITLAIILAYAIVPVNGAPVQSSVNPALQQGDIIQSVNGAPINNANAISNLSFTPGSYANLSILKNGKHLAESVVYGVYITNVLKNYPAYNAGIVKGDVVISVGNHSIENTTVFESVLSDYKAGQSVPIEFYNGTAYNTYNITFASKYSYLVSSGVSNPGIPKDYPFLGVDVAVLGITLFDQFSYVNLLRNPTSAGPLGFFVYLGLPFHFELPLPAYLTSSLYTNFILLNTEYLFYWLFWLNFALGFTNLLPIVPLDGGYVLLNTPSLQKNKKIRDALVAAVSLSVLFLILWQFIIPRI